MEWVVNIAAGVAGGLLIGVGGYILAHQDGEKFSAEKFVKSCALPVIAGAYAGTLVASPTEAFGAGVTVKYVQDLALKYREAVKG